MARTCPATTLIDPQADAQIGLIVETIAEGRSVRAELQRAQLRPPAACWWSGLPRRSASVLLDAAPLIMQMLRVAAGDGWSTPAPAGAIPTSSRKGAALALPIAEFIDALAAERVRLSKEIASLAADIDRTAKKLSNADPVARTRPEEVVEKNYERLADARASKAKLEAALASGLGDVA